MTRAMLPTICVLVLAAPVLAAESDRAAPTGKASGAAEELLRKAKAARRTAEQELARRRQQILAERKALAADLQRAYADLEVARDKADSARESLDRLTEATADLERRGALTGRRTRNLIVQAATSGDVKIDPSAPLDRVEAAVWGGFRKRLDRIRDDVQVSCQPDDVVGRDGKQRRATVIRLGAFASYACGEGREATGLLSSLPDGRMRVVGPYLDADQVEALQSAASGNLVAMPLDVDGALRNRAPGQAKTVKSWLATGGVFIYPILAVGALGVLLVLERMGYLLLTKAPPSLTEDTLERLERGATSEARDALSGARTPTARVLLSGVGTLGQTDDQREATVESALLAEAPRLERSLSLLAALAGVAPLLGLLGTVSGMIATFDTISASGTSNPRLLSGGISEALITTQLGLMVAIPLLLAHAWLRRWIERREAMLEHDAIRVLGIRETIGEDVE